MSVRLYEAGQEKLSAGLYHLPVRRRLDRAEGDDAAVPDQDVRRRPTHRPRVADEEIAYHCA
jgi:hypothetical protein